MEQAHFGERHHHAVLVARVDDEIVAHRTARLRDVGNAALFRALDVVREGKERVTAQRNAADRGKIGFLFFRGEGFGAHFEKLLPDAVAEHVFRFVGEIDIDNIVFIGPPHAVRELQGKHFFVLAQMPQIGFAARKAGAMNCLLYTS